AHEELRPHLRFETLDGRGQRGLRDERMTRRGSESAMRRDQREMPKRLQHEAMVLWQAMSQPDLREDAKKRVGQVLNHKWTIDRLVDVGGMAAVYAATHRNGKKVAIKMLHPFIASQTDIRERFLREGYVANQVEHPGAVSVLDDDI